MEGGRRKERWTGKVKEEKDRTGKEKKKDRKGRGIEDIEYL